jgi:hypothetical protein
MPAVPPRCGHSHVWRLERMLDCLTYDDGK